MKTRCATRRATTDSALSIAAAILPSPPIVPRDSYSNPSTSSHYCPEKQDPDFPMSLDSSATNGVHHDDQRPASAPPQVPPGSSAQRRPLQGDLRHRVLSSSVADIVGPDTPPLDLMPQLQRSGPSVVKTRNGSVLSRGFILKTDHYPSGMPQDDPCRVGGTH